MNSYLWRQSLATMTEKGHSYADHHELRRVEASRENTETKPKIVSTTAPTRRERAPIKPPKHCKAVTRAQLYTVGCIRSCHKVSLLRTLTLPPLSPSACGPWPPSSW